LEFWQFGRSSEQLDQTIAQLELSLEELEASESELLAPSSVSVPAVEKAKPARRALPENLPRLVKRPSLNTARTSCSRDA
jgi:hypothetical protein